MFGADFVDRGEDDVVGDEHCTGATGLLSCCGVVWIRHGWDLAGWRSLGDFGVPAYLYVPGAARGGLVVEGVKRTVLVFVASLGIDRECLRIERRGRLFGRVPIGLGTGGDGTHVGCWYVAGRFSYGGGFSCS